MSLYTIARMLPTRSFRQESEQGAALLKSPTRNPLRKRDVASRICAALFGGYASASASSMLLARLMPVPKADATAMAILLTPVLYLAAMLWAFSAPSPSRAWVVLLCITVLAGGVTWALILIGGRP